MVNFIDFYSIFYQISRPKLLLICSLFINVMKLVRDTRSEPGLPMSSIHFDKLRQKLCLKLKQTFLVVISYKVSGKFPNLNEKEKRHTYRTHYKTCYNSV